MLVIFKKLAYVAHGSYRKILLTLAAELLLKLQKAPRPAVFDVLNGSYSDLFAYMQSNSAVAVSNRVVEMELACKEKNLFIVKHWITNSFKNKSLKCKFLKIQSSFTWLLEIREVLKHFAVCSQLFWAYPIINNSFSFEHFCCLICFCYLVGISNFASSQKTEHDSYSRR